MIAFIIASCLGASLFFSLLFYAACVAAARADQIYHQIAGTDSTVAGKSCESSP